MSLAAWVHAQVGERRFHCDDVPLWGAHAPAAVRRVREAEMRHWYAGMLGIPVQVDPSASVTDFACGPESLLLTHRQQGRMVAVDPLQFLSEDEARYAAAGIERVIGPMETYAGEPTDEVWLYNCLQHVQDWELALRVACQTARVRVRLFDWIDVPTDALHLHRLQVSELVRVLSSEGLRQTTDIRGDYATGLHRPTTFYASVWEYAR